MESAKLFGSIEPEQAKTKVFKIVSRLKKESGAFDRFMFANAVENDMQLSDEQASDIFDGLFGRETVATTADLEETRDNLASILTAKGEAKAPAADTKAFFSTYSKIAGKIKKIKKLDKDAKARAEKALATATRAMGVLQKLL